MKKGQIFDFTGLSADDNQKVTLDGHSEQLQEDIPKPSTIPKTDGSGETNDNETKPVGIQSRSRYIMYEIT